MEAKISPKKFQMLVAEDYSVALKNSHARGEKPPEEELKVPSDLDRSCIISLDKKFEDLENSWLESYIRDKNNSYDQGRIEGNSIPGEKLSDLNRLINTHYIDYEAPESMGMNTSTLSFSYFDDNGNLCAFALSLLKNFPSIWIAAVTTHTIAPDGQRQVTLFAPEASPEAIEAQMTNDNSNLLTNIHQAIQQNRTYPSKKEFNEEISKNITLDNSSLVDMNLLKDFMTYAINSSLVNVCIAGLFDDNGVNIQIFNELLRSRENKASMFAFSVEKINETPNKIKLGQLLFGFIKMQTDADNPGIYQSHINRIEAVINNYSPEAYDTLIQDNYIQKVMDSFSQLKTRESIEILRTSPLFPVDNYELQNARLTLLLSSCSNLELKNKIKEFHQAINETYLNLSFITGLKKGNLAKDLCVLSDLIINPSPENFSKYQARIDTNSKSTFKRIAGGVVATSGTVFGLAGIAASTVLFPLPSIAMGIAALGLFSVGGTVAVVSFKSAKERADYKAELQNLDHVLIKANPKDWVNSQLKKIMKQNEKNEFLMSTLECLKQQVSQCKNNTQLCNVLAGSIFILTENEKDTVEYLKIFRELLQENINLDLNVIVNPIQTLTDGSLQANIAWAQRELENIALSDEIDYKAVNAMNFAIEFYQGVKDEISAMSAKNLANPKRDEILIELINCLQGGVNQDEFTRHLDNAIIALRDYKDATQIDEKLLELRRSIPIEEEDLSLNIASIGK